MSTLSPSALLKAWAVDNMPPEMAIGHVLQNLVKLASMLETHTVMLHNLRADVDRLIAQVGLPPDPKSKHKS